MSSRILVVADEAPVARGIQETLVRMGYDVPATVTSGADAIARVESDCPDLVLMDVRLRRGIDGIEKAKRLLRQEGPPVVYLASDRDPLESARERCTDGYALVKAPFNDNGLRTAIENAIHRHAVEQSLREAVDLFSLTFEEAPIGISLVSLDDRNLRVNRALCEMLGYTGEELTKLRWQTITHPDDVEEDLALQEQLMAGAIPRYELLKRYIRKDGSIVDTLLCMSLMRDNTGTPLYRIAHICDLTERKRAECARRTAELSRAAETRVRELIEQACDGIFIADPDGRLTDVNHAACEMLGISREDVVGRPIAQVLPTPEGESELRPGSSRTFEWTAKRPDGTTVPVEANASRLDDGRCQAFVRDVTDRKRVERAMADATTWLMTVLEHCPIGIAVVIGNGEQILANLHARKLFGTPLDPRRGPEQFVDYVLRPDGTRLSFGELPSQRAMHGENVASMELLALTSDGRHVPIEASAVAFRDAEGGVQGVVLVIEDISAQKERERLRAEWNSLVAHDLRQPLNSIAVRAGLLARTAPELNEPLQQISQAVVRLNRMVQDLLDLSRLEVRRMDFQRRPIDLIRIVRQAATHTIGDTEDRPLFVRAPAEALIVHADPDRIAQVIENLVSNAIKYGRPGTPIEIEIGGRDTLSVSVTNTGDGLDPEILPRIFDRFYRVGDKRGAIKGSGLGLYISREIVEAHGGALTATSTPGGTTTFRFTIPRAAS